MDSTGKIILVIAATVGILTVAISASFAAGNLDPNYEKYDIFIKNKLNNGE